MARLDFVAPSGSAALLFKMDPNHPTEEAILEYLHALKKELGETPVSVEEFYTPGDINAWKFFWRKRPDGRIDQMYDALPLATLLVNALTPFECEITHMHVRTFKDRMRRGDMLLEMWSSGRRAPSDVKSQKMRAAQKRYVARLKNDGSPESVHAQAVKAAYDKYIDACRRRKEAMEQWSAYVSQCKKELEQIRDGGPT